MLGWLRNLLKDKSLEQEMVELRQTSSKMFDALKEMSEEKERLETEIRALRETPGPDRKEYKSKEPWIEIISESFDEQKGIQISLDWNDAFIEHLKENGYQGASEDDIVRLYLAFLYRDIVERMEAEHAPKEAVTTKEKRTIRD